MTQRNQLPQSGIALDIEHLTPKHQTRGKLLVVGVGAVAIVMMAFVAVLLVFWVVLAPVILWAGILTGTAVFLSVCVVGVIKATSSHKHGKIRGKVLRLDVEHKEADVAKAWAEATERKWIAVQEELQAEHLRRRLDLVTIDHKQALYDLRNGAISYMPPTVQERNLLAAPEPDGDTLHFSDIVHRLNTAMIVGGQDSGKSTLLQWIAHSRRGQTIALDPHHGQWPVDLRVGRGRDYQSIEAMLAKVYTTMDKRYKTGENAPAINIIIDEWLSIVDNCPAAAQHIRHY